MTIGRSVDVAIATNAQNDLHVCALDSYGGLWHTIRNADGTWPFPFGDVLAQTALVGPNPAGSFDYIAIATNAQGDLHVSGPARDVLWHTIRKADGTWPFPFGDVFAQTGLVGPNPAFITSIAISTNVQGDLHVCGGGVNQGSGGFWHTIRNADGTWPFPFGDVFAQTALVGPNPSGQYGNPAIATNAQGDLHVCISTGTDLWHTIRKADGTWPFPFGDVFAQTGLVGPNPPGGVGVNPAIATNAQGDLHVCVPSADGSTLWHTIRKADGTWPFPLGDVLAQTGLVGPNPNNPSFTIVAIATNSEGDLHVCAPALGVLWHTIREADGTWPFALGNVNAQVIA